MSYVRGLVPDHPSLERLSFKRPESADSFYSFSSDFEKIAAKQVPQPVVLGPFMCCVLTCDPEVAHPAHQRALRPHRIRKGAFTARVYVFIFWREGGVERVQLAARVCVCC
jgi:hypothetical protein